MLVFVKATLLLGAVLLAMPLLRRRSAALQHGVWSAALLGLLALPVATIALPEWGRPGLHYPEETALVGVGAIETPEVSARTAAPTAQTNGRARTGPSSLPLASLLVLVWWTGVAASAVGLSGDVLRGVRARVRTRAAPADHPATRLLAEEAARIGLRRRVSLLVAPEPGVAATLGTLRPAVILGPDVLQMPRAELRAVLLHELAHVRRGDFLVNLLGALAAVAYWPNPLYWVARRRAHHQLERACDDEVLGRGVRPTDYARVLLRFAVARRALSPTLGASAGYLPLSPAKDRIHSVLTRSADRAPLTRRIATATLATAAIATVPLATLSLVSDEPGTGPTPSLVEALSHEDATVRARAARTLGRRGAVEALGSLEALVDDPAADVRLEALAAIHELGQARSIPAMARVLSRPFDGGRGEHGFVLKLAMKTLARTDHAEAAAILAAQLDRPVAQLRWLALEELMRMPGHAERALPYLRAFALTDPDERNRALATAALQRIETD